MTITDDVNGYIASNDDWCGLGSELTWNASFTGIARIHLGVCCGGTGVCGGGPTRVLAYWSTCASCNTAAPVTVIQPLPKCIVGDFDLIASSTDSLFWFATPNTMTTPVFQGDTFNTGVISSTVTYYVAAWDYVNGCYGIPTAVTAEITNPLIINYLGDTAFCDNGDAFTPNFTPSGGTVTGTGVASNMFDPVAAGVGTFTIYYSADDACNSNDSVEFTVQSAPVDPSIFACEDSSVTVTGSGPGIAWYASQLNNSVLDTGMTFNYTLDQTTILFYGDLPPSFYIDTVTATNVTISDHDAITSDDRSGVAISPNYFYIVGDGSTGRIDLDFVGPWTSWPIRDGIFSDLGTGQLYTLWDGSAGPVGTYLGSDYIITHIAPMDEDLNINSGSAIPLSTPITVNNNSSDFGIFAGDGMLIIWTSQDGNFYQVDILTGIVNNVGNGYINAYNTENIAFWGTAEIYNGEVSVTYRSDFGSYLERYMIPSATTMTVANFSGLSDMGCFTVDQNTNRFYFHHEGSSSSFGGSSETAGFCDAVMFVDAGGSTACRTAVNLIVSKPQLTLGADTTICSNDPLTLDAGSGFNSYSWSTAATTQSISAAAAGAYSVEVTDSLGCPNSDTIDIAVNMVTEIDLGTDVTVCNYQIVVLNAGGGYASYNWNNGGTSQIIYVETDTLVIGNNTFTVTALDNNGCTTTDNMNIIVTDCAGLTENDLVLMAYPNPVEDILKIQLLNNGMQVSMYLIDINGKIVSEKILTTGNTVEFDMSTLSDGVYFVRVNAGDYSNDIKVIKR